MSKRWSCAVCFETKVVPVINTGCGHTYCDGCFKATKVCPSCRKPIARLVVNYELVNDHTPAITVTATAEGSASEFMYAATERVNDLRTIVLNGRKQKIQNAVEYILQRIQSSKESLSKEAPIHCILDIANYGNSLKRDIYSAIRELLKDSFIFLVVSFILALGIPVFLFSQPLMNKSLL